jgi:hypothetical protein
MFSIVIADLSQTSHASGQSAKGCCEKRADWSKTSKLNARSNSFMAIVLVKMKVAAASIISTSPKK